MKQHPPDFDKGNLNERIELVKWEQTNKTKKLNLLTVHSLIVDDNPKFIELKSLIENYNKTPFHKLDRQNLRTSFTSKLYQMLCELVRIPIMENQISFLDKVYAWANSNKTVLQNADQLLQFQNIDTNAPHQGKSRPVTATTRTRPFSAYSRPISGISRDIASKKATIQHLQQQQMIRQLNKQLKNVDYEKLELGEREFYDGRRTRHPIYEHPRKRLKQYRRKVYYDQIDKEDSQQFKQEQIFKEKPVYDMKKYDQRIQVEGQQPKEGQQIKEGQPKDGQQGLDLGGEQQINVDDIPLDLDDQIPQQEVEQIDKLKPAVKVFQDYQPAKHNKKAYHHGYQTVDLDKAYRQRQIDQDVEIANHMAKWSNNKAANKTQTNRRAQSARMLTQKLGINRKTIEKAIQPHQSVNIVSLTNGKVFQVKSNVARPHTAFNAKSKNVIRQKIQSAITTGNLANHVKIFEDEKFQKIRPISAYAAAPKKKTFEDIIREAQEKVRNDAAQQIQTVKQVLAKNKVSISANKLTKSISCRESELPSGDDFVGQITGAGMCNNPFFKVTKKKSKKKKKK